MESPNAISSLESFLDKTQLYAKTSIELTKLKGLNATTNVVTEVIAQICVLLIAMLFFVIFKAGQPIHYSLFTTR